MTSTGKCIRVWYLRDNDHVTSVHTYDVNQVRGNYDVTKTRDHRHTWVAVTSSRCGNDDDDGGDM